MIPLAYLRSNFLGKNLHRSRELTKCFIEVIHLGQYATYSDDCESVSRWMRKLVVPVQSQLQGDTKSLYRHNGYRSNGRTDRDEYEGVFLSMLWSDLVDDNAGEDGNRSAVEEETCSYRRCEPHKCMLCKKLVPGCMA